MFETSGLRDASCGYRCQDPYFKLLDLNGDGVITANEVYGYVPTAAS